MSDERILFASADVAAEWDDAHYKLKNLMETLADFCEAHFIPPPLLTDVGRTMEFYAQNALPTKSFSWHYPCPKADGGRVFCAADMRIVGPGGDANPYWNSKERELVRSFLVDNCPMGEWELMFRTHGTGSHFHVAYRDFLLRRAWEQMHNQ